MNTAAHEQVAASDTEAKGTELLVSGMTCENCARHVGEALRGVAGVRSASVDLRAKQATVRWEAGRGSPSALVQAVREAGFEAKVAEPGHHAVGGQRFGGWGLNLLLGVPVTAVLMVGEWGLGLVMAGWFQWLSFALGALVQAFAGARFYRGAWLQLKAGSSNMDTLVALGSTTAFVYSVWALLGSKGGHLYFMEAAAIITLISLGHWIESGVSARASSALRSLLSLAPARARRLDSNGTETPVPLSALAEGDRVALRPGDRIPTDGEITEGKSSVDESMLTGESVPVDKALGSEVYAGTVNLSGRLVMRVTATGERTALAHIIEAVRRAQSSRAAIQRLGDAVSSVFVPVVVLVALAAGLWWGVASESALRVHQWLAQFLWAAHPPEGAAAGFIVAAAVLIIACPCAMGLATPAAIMAGANAAARRGILVRDGVALEKAGKISVVVFDKTGTLTLGRPAVAESLELGAEATDPESHISFHALAGALAEHSTHPISRTIAAASSTRLPVADWREFHGAGIEATVRGLDGRPATGRLGSLRWLAESGVKTDAGKAFVELWAAQGATIVGVALGSKLGGLFAVKDSLKPGARAVVGQLEREGLKVFMITGDNRPTAAAMAAQAGIAPDRVLAEVRPEKKAEWVKSLQRQGQSVAFVGDGINDAPALEQADLGIAVSRACDIAREAADFILINSEIEAVPGSLRLARATLRTIKQNLFWAFFYNALGIPLAALGFMSPVLCALAMGLSDLVVIGNALRLRARRI
jgi:Cu+-exporting ATPase